MKSKIGWSVMAIILHQIYYQLNNSLHVIERITSEPGNGIAVFLIREIIASVIDHCVTDVIHSLVEFMERA